MTSLAIRIRKVSDEIGQRSSAVEMLENKPGGHSDALKELDELVNNMEAQAAKLQVILDSTQPKPTKWLTSGERGESLAAAVHHIISERGSCTMAADALFDLILDVVKPDCRPFWKTTGALGIYGLIRSSDAAVFHDLRVRGITAEAIRNGNGIGRSICLTAFASFVDSPPSRSAESSGALVGADIKNIENLPTSETTDPDQEIRL